MSDRKKLIKELGELMKFVDIGRNTSGEGADLDDD